MTEISCSGGLMRLSQILYSNEILSSGVHVDFLVGMPCRDSRKITPGDIFFCTDGTKQSGFSYVGEAKHAGASAIVTEKGGMARICRIGIPVIEVENVRRAYALAWSRALGEPQKALRLFAVTGTNGKTSISYFLSELFRIAGHRTGLIGTVEYSDGSHSAAADYTTPPPEELYPLLLEMKNAETELVVMEASSHAISQDRLFGLPFETGIFTNLSRDHLDYHKTWEAYRDAKAGLFRNCRNSLLNLDDAMARYMGFAASGDVYYYSEKNRDAEFFFDSIRCTANGTHFLLHTYEGECIPVESSLIGGFNVYNSAAAIAAARLAGIPAEILSEAAKKLTAPPGRLEKLHIGTDFSIFIDYAHTPDALEKALSALRPITKRLTVLFGAGGERDKGKRPQMGRTAEENADFVIVTSDNPRSEPPDAIISDITAGMKKENHICITDRKEAIEYAVTHAAAGEIILLAGKGHENYICDKSGKHSFSEREIVYQILKG